MTQEMKMPKELKEKNRITIPYSKLTLANNVRKTEKQN